METTARSGKVSFKALHHDPKWQTDDNEYVLPEMKSAFVTLNVKKCRDRKIELKVSGPYSESYSFIFEIPTILRPDGLQVCCEWSDQTIRLIVDDRLVETKHESDSGFAFQLQAFEARNDEGLRALQLAIAFDMSSMILFDKIVADRIALERVPQLLVPVVVCDAFSVELYFKALYYFDHGKRKHGHKLEDLFGVLSDATKDDVRAAYEAWLLRRPTGTREPPTFFEAISDCSAAFEAWRYIHELGKPSTTIKFNGTGLREAVKEVCRARHPEMFP